MFRHTHRAARWVLVAAVLALVAVACSPLPPENAPQAIDRTQVSDLFPTSSTTTPARKVRGQVCFVPEDTEAGSSTLACEPMDLAGLSVKYLIDALAAGPDDQLRKTSGLTSFVPPDTRVLGTEEVNDGQTLIVDLSEEITDVSSPNNVRAYQQIVWTLTDPANGLGIDSVGLRVVGSQLEIPTADQSKWTANRWDFIPKPTAPSTTRPKAD